MVRLSGHFAATNCVNARAYPNGISINLNFRLSRAGGNPISLKYHDLMKLGFPPGATLVVVRGNDGLMEAPQSCWRFFACFRLTVVDTLPAEAGT